MKKVSFLVFFLVSVIFCGCSNSSPEIKSALFTVIYDYKDFKSNPEVRFSVLLDSSSDVRRYEKISVKCEENNFIWNTDELVSFTFVKKSYVGNVNFLMPLNQKIAQGKYFITFENADGQNSEIEYNLKYDNSFYNLKAENAKKKVMESAYKSKVAIFNSENQLIFFGDNKLSKEEIAKSYRTAKYYREMWSTQNDGILCIMPIELISE